MQDWWRASAELLRLQTAYGRMALAAAEVIGRRSFLMAQGAMTAAETTRMVLEKPATFADAAMRASVAAARGASPTRIAEAGLRPIARKARSNARRLGR